MSLNHHELDRTEMEFKEFEPRFESAKTRFKLNTGLNLVTFDLNQPNLSRGLNLNRRSNSLNSATECVIEKARLMQHFDTIV